MNGQTAIQKNKGRLWNIQKNWVARCTKEINSIISLAKAANKQEKVFLHQQIGLTFKKEIRKNATFGARLYVVLKIGHFAK